MGVSQRDNDRLRRLLRRQSGLLNVDQAHALGVSRSTLSRLTRGPTATWQRVLPGVYASFPHTLTPAQWAVAGWLLCGPDSVITGVAALRAWGFRYLPTDVRVDVLVGRGSQPRSCGRVRVRRTERLPRGSRINGVLVAAVPRAVVDSCRWLSSYDDVVALAAEAVQRRRATVDELIAELDAASLRGTRLLRRALDTVVAGARSAAEARALDLVRRAGLPPPRVNEGLVVDGALVARPDLRWGRLIVEIDSKEWHLLAPGSWEATQRRRRRLERLGFVVLVITPADLVTDPHGVVADIAARLAQLHAGA